MFVYTVHSATTDEQGRTERGDWWRVQSPASVGCAYDMDVAADLSASIDVQDAGGSRLITWSSGPEFLRRSAQQIRRDPHDAYQLFIPLAGTMTMRQGEDAMVAGTSNVMLATFDRPFIYSHDEDVRGMVLTIPADYLNPRLSTKVFEGMLLDSQAGIGRIVTDQLASLYRERHNIDGTLFNAVADRVVDIVALAYNSHEDTAAADSAVQAALVESIRRYVKANAHDPALNTALIAARLGWSERHIQSQLQRAGTTASELIREERLTLARLRLQDPRWGHQSVTALAHSSGFGDLSTFSSAYRRRFGERPSDTRDKATVGADHAFTQNIARVG